MIPKIIHYIWIGANGKPFNMHHMASINAVHFHNPDYKIKLHCDAEPSGEYYDRIKHLLTIEYVTVPDTVFGVPILNNPNKATVIRLDILIAEGGIYQDLDIIALRPYDDLLDNEMCMGLELSEELTLRQKFGLLRTKPAEIIKYRGRVIKGLCNGFIMAEKGAQYLKDWYEGFRGYRNTNWGYYSVIMPYALFKTGKYKFHIIPAYQAHFPSCRPVDQKIIFEKNISYNGKYAGKYFLHTWESKSFKQYLSKIDENVVKTSNTTYCNAIRNFI